MTNALSTYDPGLFPINNMIKVHDMSCYSRLMHCRQEGPSCVPCKNCKKAFIGETGRKFGKRLEEHRAETEKVASNVRIRTTRKASQSTVQKSAIILAKVVGRESDRYKRWIKEFNWNHIYIHINFSFPILHCSALFFGIYFYIIFVCVCVSVLFFALCILRKRRFIYADIVLYFVLKKSSEL